MPSNRNMRFPISLQGKNKTVNTTMLIDSGATGNFMDICLLSFDNFTLICLPDPIIAYNVDGTMNQKGTIHWRARTTLTIENHSDPIKLMILQLSKPQVIFGIPWLKKWNPRINWNHLSMTLPPSPYHHIPYHACYLDLNSDHEISWLFSLRSSAEDDLSLHEYHLLAEGSEKQINKVTILTQLAQADKPKDIPILDVCADFADVFSEKTYNILPPHQPFDHPIELKDSFVPKIDKVYPLNPAEKEACKAFINEHLKTG